MPNCWLLGGDVELKVIAAKSLVDQYLFKLPKNNYGIYATHSFIARIDDITLETTTDADGGSNRTFVGVGELVNLISIYTEI